MGSSQRFLRAIAAVLFLAVCAYCGAALGRLFSAEAELSEACLTQVEGSFSLQGVAVRSEEALCLNDAEILQEDGSRLKAGTVLAQNQRQILLAESSGIFFAGLDGYEYLDPEMLRDLTVSAFSGILKCKPNFPEGSIGRLVTDHVWYFAALCPVSAGLDEGDECLLRFEGLEQAVPARVAAISPPEGEELAAVFRLSSGSAGLLSLRLCSAQLIRPDIEGLKIPASALFSDGEGNTFVNILSDGLSQSRRVDIIYEDPARQWCLSALSSDPEALAQGDMVIRSAVQGITGG